VLQCPMTERSARSRPFKSHATILRQEVREAVDELGRPARGQLLSGLMAGIGVGFSVLLIGAIATLAPEDLGDLQLALLVAQAYAIGFVLVVMGRTDLFTEYTTIALLPVLTGDAGVGALLRFWGLVFAANLVGGSLMALAIAAAGPGLGVFDAERFGAVARDLVVRDGSALLLGGVLAGWLMGLLSWLVVAGRESVSQILFVWIVGGAIGFGHLPHAITGTIEGVLAAMHGAVSPGELGRFLLWTTLGNVVGGVAFALSIRFGVRRGEGAGDGEDGDDDGGER
jgi:formate-nitrite transporter family protein